MEESMAEAGLLRLYALYEWVSETVKLLQFTEDGSTASGCFRTGPIDLHADRVFEQ